MVFHKPYEGDSVRIDSESVIKFSYYFRKALNKRVVGLTSSLCIIFLTLSSSVKAETVILRDKGDLRDRATISNRAVIVTVGEPESDGSKISLIKDDEILYITPDAEGKNVDPHYLRDNGQIQVSLMTWVVPLNGQTPHEFYNSGVSLRTVGSLMELPLFEMSIKKMTLKDELLTVFFQDTAIPGFEINNRIEEQERKYHHKDHFRLYYLYFDMYGFRGSRTLLKENETEFIWDKEYPEFVIESYRPFNALRGFQCARTISLEIRTFCNYKINIK